MSKKLLIANGSPRVKGLDVALANMISENVKKFGYETEVANVSRMRINGCRACMSCKAMGRCIQEDDMVRMYDKIRNSDMLILTSPIYLGAETGQMKCFIDRFYAMFRMVDDNKLVDFGKVSKASVLLTCDEPDGAMIYGGVLTRLTKVLRYLGVEDVSGTIIPGVSVDSATDSVLVKEYLESLDFQLGM